MDKDKGKFNIEIGLENGNRHYLLLAFLKIIL